MLQKTHTAVVARLYEEWLKNLEPSAIPVMKADPLRPWIAAFAMAEERMLAALAEVAEPGEVLDYARVAVPLHAAPLPEQHDAPPVRKSKGARAKKL